MVQESPAISGPPLGFRAVAHRDDDVGLLEFSLKVVGMLEKTVIGLVEIVDAKCYDILEIVGTGIFTNLLHVLPSFDDVSLMREEERLVLSLEAARDLAEGNRGEKQ